MSSKSLRSLMKDRQLAKRIQHQFAKYDTSGRLTCTICNGLTVKSEALWPSHLTSKAHRLNYQNYQTSVNSHSETTNGSSSAPTLSKRKPEEMSSENQIDRSGSQEKKVRFDGPSSSEENTRESSNINPQSKSSLPADFFDDPSQTPSNLDDQSEEKEEEEEDPEWKAFEAALQDPTTEDTSANLFAQASLIAEPVLYDSGKPAEMDSELVDGQLLEEQQQEGEEEEEDPIEKKIREEKEEIMDRIQNEEREQLEADQRVLRMKARVNAFRASRKKITKSIAT
ncbi:hypothetical protein PGTUg99_031625 [Puccinia graminis f. sp. tritici]|uniref:Coiled-coil domain-containing protein 16 n=1 Tax=Puccinia graminis f. sp. tritici TaxID=56615 RepID=A0A5B0SIQ7_PUCGR|nr:hypothetical protein PGTUg99_031625 [Puccinia graminis f. sp. tritici]